jgi:hypothetical protein
MHNNACFGSSLVQNAERCILLHIITMTKHGTMGGSGVAPQGDGAPEQTEVTPEMIEAGAAEIAAWLEGEDWDYRKVIARVYRAMRLQVSKSKSRSSGRKRLGH